MSSSTRPRLAVRTVGVVDLTLDPSNARKHGARNLAAIKESLARFGQRRPLVVTSDLVVVAGNGTLEAARELGWKTVAVTVVPDEWSLDQVRAYALADNRTAELAAWDGDLLDEQLSELDGAGWDMAALGFENPAGGAGEDLDEIPDVPDKPRTKPGDRWMLGAHRLVCGSATDQDAVARAVGEDRINGVITDPPYGVEYVGKAKSTGTTIANDDLSDDGLRRLVEEALGLARRRAAPGSPIYLFHAERARPAFQQAFEAAGWHHAQTLIWVKDRFVLGRVDYHYQHEPILYGWKPGRHAWFGGRRRSTLVHDGGPDFETWSREQLLEYVKALAEDEGSVIRHDRPAKSLDHPTMKPVALLARLLTASTRRGGGRVRPVHGLRLDADRRGVHGSHLLRDRARARPLRRRRQAMGGPDRLESEAGMIGPGRGFRRNRRPPRRDGRAPRRSRA